jgi:hypothetical protein
VQGFIVDPLFRGVGVRRYAVPGQLHALAQVSLEHMLMTLRQMQQATARALVSDTSALLGAHVLQQILTPGSPVLKEMMSHVFDVGVSLTPASVDRLQERRSHGQSGAAAEKVRVCW